MNAIIEIPKITLNAFKIFGDEKLEAELDRQENAVKAAWSAIYNSIASGGNSIAYWDGKPVERPGVQKLYAVRPAQVGKTGWISTVVGNGDPQRRNHPHF